MKLIDGHLRRDLDPDLEVEVEILDVSDAEARALLLNIDPLASLAENQAQLQERLQSLTPTVSLELRMAWEAAAVGGCCRIARLRMPATCDLACSST